MARHPFQHGAPGHRLKEGRNLFRFFGVLTGSGLLAASLWLVNMTSAQDSPFDAPAGNAGPAPTGATPAAGARNPFAPEAASPAATAAEAGRRRVDDYLRRARAAQKQ